MNSWHAQQLKFAIGIGGMMSFYGIVGVLTYTVGPKLGLHVSQQIMVLIVLLLTFPIALIIGYVATRKKKDPADAAKTDAAGATPGQPGAAGAAETAGAAATAPKAVSAGAVQELSGSVEEVVNFLKTSNLAGANSKDAIYALPWYIVAGTPKSGKSSLVIGSNLNFQTLPSQRQSEQKMIRPTRGVDWRVTSDAVFVDTAGSYQTEGTSEGEWSALLESIRKYRGQRPLDGMLLVADAEQILGSDERQIEEMAKVMRARLDDAMQRFKVRFPVYLIFSHADSIEGFRDSFSTSKKEGETLVWGATIPLEKSAEAHQMFDEEFGLLQTSVMKRRLMRLSAPFPAVRQLRIFNFPLHFGSARRKLGAFVAALFRPNPFSENPFLRGYYFISTPPAQPDKALGAGLPQSVGRTYFTEKLVRDVVLRDKDLVATFQKQRQKPPIFSWLLTMFGALLVLTLLTIAGVSLANNRRLLKRAEELGGAMIVIAKEDSNVSPLTKGADAATREINAMEDMRVLLEDLDKYDRNGPPLKLGMGLYSGNAIYKGSDKTKGLLNIYYNAVDRRFMAPTVKKLEEELRKFVAGPAVKNQNAMTIEEEDSLSRGYDMLKVYLMLSDKYKARSNADDITKVLKDFWVSESKLPAALKDDAENQLRFYARQSDRLEGPDKFPRIQTDNNLVTEVRKRLMILPPYKRYYKEKVTEISKEIETRIGEFSVNGMLLRAGGATDYFESKVSVPGVYTVEGFKAMDKAIVNADLTKINWVVSDDVKPNTDPAALIQQEDAAKIREQYFRDYDDRWRDFVKSIRVRSYRKENEKDPARLGAKDALQTFSSESSPMKLLLLEIVRNTDLSAKPVAKGWWDTIKGWFKPDTLPDTGGLTPVERDFGPVFDFVKPKADGKAKIDDLKVSVDKIGNQFSALSDSEINRIAGSPDEDNVPLLKNLKNEVASVEKLVKPLRDSKDSPSAPVIADLLAQPLGNLRALLSADSVKQLGEKWSNEVVPIAMLAESGYPFETADTNADFQKLKEYLAPNSGKLSQFYDQNLKKYFDGNPGQLKLRDPNNTPFTPEFVDYLNKALTLRQALFGKGDDMKFEYNFEITNPGDAIVELSIDGTTLSSAEKPSSPVSFPATTGGGNGVLIKLATAAAVPATGPSPAATANPAAPAVNSNSAKPTAGKTPAPTTGGSSPDEKTFLGPWGLFRFFDACGPQKQSDNSYLLTYKLKSGKTLTAKITPSGVDPFNKEIYRLRAPKTIIK